MGHPSTQVPLHPYLFHSGHLFVPMFGALAALGLMLGLVLSLRTAARAGIDPDTVWDAGLFGLTAAFVLSRLLLIATNWHSFMKYPVLMIAVPSLTPMGLLLTAAATGVWMWMHRLPWLATLDAWAPCATLVWMFLALGHFAEGSDPGMPSGAGWGVTMPGSSVREYPVSLFAVFAAILVTIALMWSLGRRKDQGDTFAGGLAAVGLAQFFLSFLREPSMDAVGGLDPLQWVAVGMVGMAGVVWAMRRPEVGVS